jgi:hypothetical protein
MIDGGASGGNQPSQVNPELLGNITALIAGFSPEGSTAEEAAGVLEDTEQLFDGLTAALLDNPRGVKAMLQSAGPRLPIVMEIARAAGLDLQHQRVARMMLAIIDDAEPK